MSGILSDVRALADRLAAEGRAGAATARARLDEPVRVAIVGRVNAGKSTLLNALVGDHLAATDATETTLIPTWYRHGTRYEVIGVRRDGSTIEVPHRREGGGLHLDLAGLDRTSIQRLEVRWPSSRLENMTLIDTPGLDGEVGVDDVDADAIVVVMRYRHAADAAFLEAFTGSRAGVPTAASALAVLSRADEVAGGSDAFAVASRAAERIAADPRIGPLCATVLPVAGLLGEAAATLTEDDVTTLRAVAGLPEEIRTSALQSVDRFRSAPVDAAPSARHELLVRMGMVGVRAAVGVLVDDPSAGAAAIAAQLADLSGVEVLARELDARFGVRSEALRALSAGAVLRSDGADDVARELERIEASSDELIAMRLAGLVAEGIPGSSDDDRRALRALAATDEPATRLQVAEASPDAAASVAAGWRARESDPFAEPEMIEAARLAARLAEGIYAELTG